MNTANNGLPRISVGRRTRADDVADLLTELIESGEFAVGSQLPSEKELAERFGVGRPSVRQALFFLQQQGSVQIASGTRARVARPSFDFMNEQAIAMVKRTASTPEGQKHMEMARLLFEPGVALQAAMVATDEDIIDFKRRLDANVAAAGNIPLFVRTIHEVMRDWLIDQRTNTSALVGVDQVSIRDHTAIYEAVAAREPMRAFHEMTSHLRLISEFYQEAKRISDTVFRNMVTDVTKRVEVEMQQLWKTSHTAQGAAKAAPAATKRKRGA
jgi:DNA-binding FadR family transcriptional regulator